MIKDFVYIYKLCTDPEISRLRVLLGWGIVSIAIDAVTYGIITTNGNYSANVESASSSNPMFILVFGTSLLPILFYFTNGLNGFHKAFEAISKKIFSKFYEVPEAELIEEYGEDEGKLLKERVYNMQNLSGFLFLEILILGYGFIGYFFFGRMNQLALLGYMADDLVLGAIVFIAEAIRTITVGWKAAPIVYKLRKQEE